MRVIFALDCSGKSAGVCVFRGGEVIFEKTLHLGLTHSETLLVLVDEAFRSTGLTPAGVDLWAVTGGPGSFTGLRIGMSMVKGLALPGCAPAVAVSTLEAHAWGCGLRGTVVPALDARRSEVYWAAFACGDEMTRLAPDAAGPPDDIAETVRQSQSPVFFVGDGAELCYTIFNCEPRVMRPGAGYALSVARGAGLAVLHAQPGGELAAAQLRPSYLRLSQAERERAARLAAAKGDAKGG